MILTLEIDQMGPAQYRAVLTHGGVEVTEPTTHPSIASAISECAAAVPANFAFFIEPRYAGFSAGTMRISDAAREDIAEAAAQKMARMLRELIELKGR